MPRFAYRCTPMVVANGLGWELLNPLDLDASWDGGNHIGAVAVTPHPLARPHFGFGVLTFQLPYLFRTPPGWNLWVKGPANHVRDGIQPLEGIVEADTAVETFTMNWRFTRPGTVRFEAGAPLLSLVPVEREAAERFQPVLREIREEPELALAHAAWSESRLAFNSDPRRPDRPQGDYLRRVAQKKVTLSEPTAALPSEPCLQRKSSRFGSTSTSTDANSARRPG